MVKMARIENDLGTGSGRNTMRWGIIKPPITKRRIVSKLVVFHLSPGKKNIAAKVPFGTLFFFNGLKLPPFLLCSQLNWGLRR